MMEKFKQLLQSKAKEGKTIKDPQDLKARFEMVAGMEDVAQEAFGTKLKGLKEKQSHPAAPAEKALPKDAQVGKSQEEVPHDAKDIPSEVISEEESPEHEDSESAEKEVAETKDESDMKKRNKDRKQYA